MEDLSIQEIIKKFEGIKLTSYQCSANVWTIGYGHTKGIIEGMEINEEINLCVKNLAIYLPSNLTFISFVAMLQGVLTTQ